MSSNGDGRVVPLEGRVSMKAGACVGLEKTKWPPMAVPVRVDPTKLVPDLLFDVGADEAPRLAAREVQLALQNLRDLFTVAEMSLMITYPALRPDQQAAADRMLARGVLQAVTPEVGGDDAA